MQLEPCQKLSTQKSFNFYPQIPSYSSSKGCLHGSGMFLANVKTKISNYKGLEITNNLLLWWSHIGGGRNQQ